MAVPPVILLVEDEPAVQRVTCQYLEEAGMVCLAADNAAQAMDILGAGQVPDLLVLDVRLPDLPGPELALRIHSRYPRIPVLFVSGWVDGLANPGTLEALAWGFLQKPYTGEALVERVRRMVPARSAAG
ncbi:MAG TPA: response regulator [Gemmatimonadales bacterium]|nr:response regulator [Gemmatimonadales bacterium]